MRKRLWPILLFILVGLCPGQQNLPPDCRPITYFGVTGCEPSVNPACPAGYHLQAVGPTNPAMKAPTRQICVADSKPSAPAKSPEATVEEFYKWYVHSLRQKREPLEDDEAGLKKYVNAALIDKLKKQMNSSNGPDVDYFLKAQDYLDEWETNVSTTKGMVADTVATITVSLEAKDTVRPHKLKVTLLKENGEWKISKVEKFVTARK